MVSKVKIDVSKDSEPQWKSFETGELKLEAIPD